MSFIKAVGTDLLAVVVDGECGVYKPPAASVTFGVFIGQLDYFFTFFTQFCLIPTLAEGDYLGGDTGVIRI